MLWLRFWGVLWNLVKPCITSMELKPTIHWIIFRFAKEITGRVWFTFADIADQRI
jgi:hypothetical protein